MFLVPTLVGASAIPAFYLMILYFNGGPVGITPAESSGLFICILVIAAVSALLYLVYRLTRRSVCRVLRVQT